MTAEGAANMLKHELEMLDYWSARVAYLRRRVDAMEYVSRQECECNWHLTLPQVRRSVYCGEAPQEGIYSIDQARVYTPSPMAGTSGFIKGQ